MDFAVQWRFWGHILPAIRDFIREWAGMPCPLLLLPVQILFF